MTPSVFGHFVFAVVIVAAGFAFMDRHRVAAVLATTAASAVVLPFVLGQTPTGQVTTSSATGVPPLTTDIGISRVREQSNPYTPFMPNRSIPNSP
jgi:hypothetical protein